MALSPPVRSRGLPNFALVFGSHLCMDDLSSIMNNSSLENSKKEGVSAFIRDHNNNWIVGVFHHISSAASVEMRL